MGRRADFLSVLTVIGAACVLHGPAILRGRVLLPADVVLLMRPWGLTARQRFPEFRFTQNQMLGPIFEYYSWRYQARERIRSGEVPLWNPLELSGNVLLANSQSAVLYPPNLLLYFLPLWKGINLVTLFHTALTGLLMLGFLRSLRVSHEAAVTGALGWMLCGPLLVWTEFQTPTAALCWLPGVLWAWEASCRRQRWGTGCALAAVTLALSLVAGHPQFAFYAILAGVLYMIWRAPLVSFWTVPVTLAAAVALGGATLLPVAEASRINHRQENRTFVESVKLRLPPLYLLGLVAPNVLGNPRDYVRVVDGQPMPGNPYIGEYDYIEYCHYAGLAVLILALVGLWRSFAHGHVRFLMVLGLLGMALALGTPVGAPLYYLVPGYSQFHAPARAMCLVAFSLCGLAAFGIHALKEASYRGVQDEGNRSRPETVVTAFSVSCGLLAIGAWPVMALQRPELWAAEWVSYEATGIRHGVLVAAATGLLCWAVLRSGSRLRQLALLGLPVLCALDLLAWSWNFNPATDPAMLGGESAAAQALKAAWPGRVLSLETPGAGIKSLIVPNYNAVVGYREVQGADSVHSRRYHLAMARVVHHMTGQDTAFPDANTIRLPSGDHPLLDALNVTHVTTAPPATLPLEAFRREADTELTIWRNTRAMGPAWVVSRYVPSSGPAEAVDWLASAGVDLKLMATLEGGEPTLDQGAGGTANMASFVAHRVEYDVETSGRALLVTSEPAYAGWHATITTEGSSVPARIFVANGVLRAVVVPPGHSRVVFRYEPASYRTGLYLSCVAAALLAATLIAGALARNRAPHQA